MKKIVKDASLDQERLIGILDVQYPAKEKWDIEGFETMKEKELQIIKAGAAEYDREVVFRQSPYFRYFRKFKKTYPVMMQVESFLLKDRPFPEGAYINSVAFLAELKCHNLLGTHDADRIVGDLVFYHETEKVDFEGLWGETFHTYPKDVSGRDDEGVIMSLIAGADSKTCVHEDSTHVIYIMFGVPGIEEETIRETAEQIREYATRLAPDARCEFAIY